jgi:hypothetical protein
VRIFLFEAAFRVSISATTSPVDVDFSGERAGCNMSRAVLGRARLRPRFRVLLFAFLVVLLTVPSFALAAGAAPSRGRTVTAPLVALSIFGSGDLVVVRIGDGLSPCHCRISSSSISS